jgi:hypothetical protein
LNELPNEEKPGIEDTPSDKPKMLNSNSKNLQKFLSAPSVFALDGKAGKKAKCSNGPLNDE